MTIIVTNNSSEEFADRYNGNDFVFPVGKRTMIDEDAARHIFGIGVADKTQHLVRLGWIRSTGEVEAAMTRLGQFSFATYDPFAAFEQEEATEQQLSPVAPGGTVNSETDGSGEAVLPTPPAKASKGEGILAKLQGQ